MTVYIATMVPETKGVSVEAIEKQWETCGPPSKCRDMPACPGCRTCAHMQAMLPTTIISNAA